MHTVFTVVLRAKVRGSWRSTRKGFIYYSLCGLCSILLLGHTKELGSGSLFYFNLIKLILFYFRQGFSVQQPWLSWNQLYRAGWHPTQRATFLCIPCARIKDAHHHCLVEVVLLYVQVCEHQAWGPEVDIGQSLLFLHFFFIGAMVFRWTQSSLRDETDGQQAPEIILSVLPLFPQHWGCRRLLLSPACMLGI